MITGLLGAASCNCFLHVTDGQKKAANSLWLWPSTNATNQSAVAELKNEISCGTCDMIQTEMSTLSFCWALSRVLCGRRSCCYATLISAVTWRKVALTLVTVFFYFADNGMSWHMSQVNILCCSEIKKWESSWQNIIFCSITWLQYRYLFFHIALAC